MLRRCLFTVSLAITLFPYAGCRSCSSCHDCDPPVVGCDAGGCGCHRAGSVSGHYPPGEYAGEGYPAGIDPNLQETPTTETEAPIDMPIEAPTTLDTGEMP